MKLNSPHIQRNRFAHLRDRDIYLRAVRRKLDYFEKHIQKLLKKGVWNGKITAHLQDLESDNRKALHHAEEALSYLKQIGTGLEPEQMQEVILADFLRTIHSMCGCALRHLAHCDQIRQLAQSYRGPQNDSVHHYIGDMLASTERMIRGFISDMQDRMRLLDDFISATE